MSSNKSIHFHWVFCSSQGTLNVQEWEWVDRRKEGVEELGSVATQRGSGQPPFCRGIAVFCVFVLHRVYYCSEKLQRGYLWMGEWKCWLVTALSCCWALWESVSPLRGTRGYLLRDAICCLTCQKSQDLATSTTTLTEVRIKRCCPHNETFPMKRLIQTSQQMQLHNIIQIHIPGDIDSGLMYIFQIISYRKSS